MTGTANAQMLECVISIVSDFADQYNTCSE